MNVVKEIKSAFTYLKHRSVGYVKINDTFVRDTVEDPVDMAMVRSANHIAHSLDKLTVAEFVEGQEVLDISREIGVDLAQGYFLGRPAGTI